MPINGASAVTAAARLWRPLKAMTKPPAQILLRLWPMAANFEVQAGFPICLADRTQRCAATVESGDWANGLQAIAVARCSVRLAGEVVQTDSRISCRCPRSLRLVCCRSRECGLLCDL